MLKKLISEGYGIKEDLSCSETILYGANKVYHLGLDEKALKLASAFGGGMGIESVCGAITGALMVLGRLFVADVAHKYPKIKELDKEYFERFKNEMGDIICKPLKNNYRTDDLKCKVVILKSAEILDEIIARELKNIPKSDNITS